jgi:hypothetical protein
MSTKIQVMKLEKWWPKGKTVTRNRIDAASVQYRIGHYFEELHGFSVMKLDGNDWKTHQSIPPKYRHALRFMNFKDACYISALGVDVGHIDLSTAHGMKWATMRDGMTRNLVFDADIRKAFFGDVESQILQHSSIPLNIAGFRSVAMDTWLIEEYLFKGHAPAMCESLNRSKPYTKDPLLFGESSDDDLSQLMNGFSGTSRLDGVGDVKQHSLLRIGDR